MEDIFESLKTFVITDEDLSRHEVIQNTDIPWNKGITGYTTQPCSEETKRKISIARKAQGTPWLKGFKPSKGAIEKNRQTHLGKKHNEETKKKIAKTLTGKTHSEETKKKQSESVKGRSKTYLKGKPRSEETKKKIAESQAKRHALRKGK